jgi:hypothetical protein
MTFSDQQPAPIRTRAEIDSLDRIDARVREVAASMGACEMRYPALIAREVLERAEYPSAFPHLLMSVSSKCIAKADGADAARAADRWCLSPAVCHHVFAQLAGRMIPDPLVLTARGRCFRAERDASAGVRQIEFEMREIVLLGPTAWIDACVAAAARTMPCMAEEMGISGSWQEAEDPFFLPAGAGRALMQRMQKVKLEYQSPGPGGLALSSINRHGSFFSERFGIMTPAGSPVHTACVAVGLDRWASRCRAAQREETER